MPSTLPVLSAAERLPCEAADLCRWSIQSHVSPFRMSEMVLLRALVPLAQMSSSSDDSISSIAHELNPNDAPGFVVALKSVQPAIGDDEVGDEQIVNSVIVIKAVDDSKCTLDWCCQLNRAGALLFSPDLLGEDDVLVQNVSRIASESL